MTNPENKGFVHRSDVVLQVFRIFLSMYFKTLPEGPTAWLTEESCLYHPFNLPASIKDADMLANKRQSQVVFLQKLNNTFQGGATRNPLDRIRAEE